MKILCKIFGHPQKRDVILNVIEGCLEREKCKRCGMLLYQREAFGNHYIHPTSNHKKFTTGATF